MALVKPIAQIKTSFDASKDEMFYFSSTGGDQVVKNRLVINRQRDNVVVYDETIESYKFEHLLPSSTLTNNEYYNYYFITYDINGNASPQSNIIQFRCYSTPIIRFSNLPSDRMVGNATYTFEFSYSQFAGELADYFVFYLYDSSKVLLSTSERIYDTSLESRQYTVEGLENNETYYVQVKCQTIGGITAETDLEIINVRYINPSVFTNLNLENRCEEGYIRGTSFIELADGHSNAETLKYVNIRDNPDDYIKWNIPYELKEDNIIGIWYDGTKPLVDALDIRDSGIFVEWDKGYVIPRDFTLSAFLKKGLLGKIMTIGTEENGYILNLVREVPYGEQRVKDYVELKGYNNGELFVYQRSNYIDMTNSHTFLAIWLRKVNQNYDLRLNIIDLGQDDVMVWDEESNFDYDTITSLIWEDEPFNRGGRYTPMNNNMDSVFPITDLKIYNGIYDNLDITQNITRPFDMESTLIWDYDTRLNCTFDGNINGGNIDVIMSKLSGFRVKRREKDEFGKWITIKEFDIDNVEQTHFTFEDYLVPSNTTQEYALVPMLEDGVEGDYLIQSIDTKFNGVFINTKDKNFKLYNGVAFGGLVDNTESGSLQPIGSKYPVIIRNSNTEYISGSVSGRLYGYDFDRNRIINTHSIKLQTEDLVSLLNSGYAICIKDWNGNIWIGSVVDNTNIDYEVSNGHTSISFNFVEQGKYDNQQDLYKNGLIDVI